MSWRDREGGHVVREEADWTALGKLPKGVALQVHRYESDDLTCYFIATRDITSMKWPADDDGFAEFAPHGSQSFRRRVRECVPEFCAAFDLLHRQSLDAGSEGGFGPSAKIGELSLGFQMAALLGTRVLSFISDPDYDADFACEHTPDGPARVACVRSFVHLLHDRNRVRAAPLADEDIPGEVVNVLRGTPGVTIARVQDVDLAPRGVTPAA